MWLSHPPKFEEIRVWLLSGAKGSGSQPGCPPESPGRLCTSCSPGRAPSRHSVSGISARARFGNPWNEELPSGRDRRGFQGFPVVSVFLRKIPLSDQANIAELEQHRLASKTSGEDGRMCQKDGTHQGIGGQGDTEKEGKTARIVVFCFKCVSPIILFIFLREQFVLIKQ